MIVLNLIVFVSIKMGPTLWQRYEVQIFARKQHYDGMKYMHRISFIVKSPSTKVSVGTHFLCLSIHSDQYYGNMLNCMFWDCIAINNKLDNSDNQKFTILILLLRERNSIMNAWRFIIHRQNRNNFGDI